MTLKGRTDVVTGCNSRIMLAMIVVLALISSGIEAGEDSSVDCPKIEDLNQTTRFYLGKAMARLVSEQQYASELNSAGFVTPLHVGDFRLLTTEEDSAVCQKLNEIYGDFYSSDVFDRETGEYVPSMFGVYYDVQDKYVVVWQPYNPGSDMAGKIGPPGAGWRFAIVYEKDNLTYLGRIGF